MSGRGPGKCVVSRFGLINCWFFHRLKKDNLTSSPLPPADES
jgi:hypothetical protein